ncbi:hypothetical protein JCM12141A_64240 [Mycolicibacterium hodleri]
MKVANGANGGGVRCRGGGGSGSAAGVNRRQSEGAQLGSGEQSSGDGMAIARTVGLLGGPNLAAQRGDAGVEVGEFGDVLVALMGLRFGEFSEDAGAFGRIGHGSFLVA